MLFSTARLPAISTPLSLSASSLLSLPLLPAFPFPQLFKLGMEDAGAMSGAALRGWMRVRGDWGDKMRKNHSLRVSALRECCALSARDFI